MVEKDEIVEEVLAYVNSARILAGKKPLVDLRSGFKSKASNCPLVNSLKELSTESITIDAHSIIMTSTLAKICIQAWQTKVCGETSLFDDYCEVQIPEVFTSFIDFF
jgi:hypothetical protein